MPEMETTLPGNPPLTARQIQSRDCLLVFCQVLNVATALCLVLCAAAFAMAMVLRADASHKDLYVLSGQIVRVFGIVWSLCLVLVESEWRFVKKAVPLLDLWLGRGIAHFFIASLTFREAYPSEEGSDFQKSLQLYRTIASASLTACGLVYMAGGVVCMGAIRRARQQREDRLLAAAAEFDELERRRGELRRLLGRSEEP